MRIKSDVNVAVGLAANLRNTGNMAETLKPVAPAESVNVSVNQECMSTYKAGQDAFSSYKSVSEKDAGRIRKIAANIQELDNSMARAMN